MPLAGSEFLDLQFTHHPLIALGVDGHLVVGAGKNAAALFLVKHAVVLGFVGDHVALVAGDHVEPKLGGVGAAVLNAAVASGGNAHLHLEVEVTHGGHLPSNEMVHLERTVGLSSENTILMRPQLRVPRPSAHSAAEEIGKPGGSRAVGHGGGRLGVWLRGDAQGTVHGLKGPAEFGHPLVRALTELLERLGMLGILGEVDQFVGIVLEVVKELVVFLIDVANVLVAIGTQTLEGGDAMTHREVLVKGLLAPIIRLAGGHDGLEA